MKIYRLIILVILFTSCSSVSPHMKAYYPIESEHFRFIKKQGDFHIYGNGGNFNKGKINLVIISADKIGSANIEQARRDIIFLTQDIIQRLNSSQKLQPYLSNPPFDHNQLQYSITYCKNNLYSNITEKDEQNQKITLVSLLMGKISYDVRPSEKSGYKEVHEESYEEALEILKNQGINFSN